MVKMSARPRPVTATINYQQPDSSLSSLQPRHRSLSSGCSTASLCSVLDHDSYESPPPSEDEQEGREPSDRTSREDQDSPSPSSHTSPTSKFEDQGSVEYTDPVTTFTSSPSTPTNQVRRQDSLSPWEKWMVQKAKDLRIQHQMKLEEIQRHKVKEEQKKVEEKLKQEKAARARKQWVEKKDSELRSKERNEERKKQAEKEMEERKKQDIEEKSLQKFNEWKAKKRAEEREKKKAELEKKKEEEKEKAERQQKCKEVFEDWLNKAKERPRTAPQSYGYSSGKITGYYNRDSYPSPTFYNPIPWQPIHIPQPEGSRKKRLKSKKKNQWNPNKYL